MQIQKMLQSGFSWKFRPKPETRSCSLEEKTFSSQLSLGEKRSSYLAQRLLVCRNHSGPSSGRSFESGYTTFAQTPRYSCHSTLSGVAASQQLQQCLVQKLENSISKRVAEVQAGGWHRIDRKDDSEPLLHLTIQTKKSSLMRPSCPRKSRHGRQHSARVDDRPSHFLRKMQFCKGPLQESVHPSTAPTVGNNS